MSVTYQRPKQRARSEVLPTNKSQVGYPAKVIGQTSKVNDWALPLGVFGELVQSEVMCRNYKSEEKNINYMND